MVEGETIEHVRLQSPGISGDGDVRRLESDLGGIVGIRSVRGDPGKHTLEVTFDPRVVSLPRILEIMQAAGYTVQGEQFGSPRDAD